jgi:DNA protecting protein DprA
MTYSSSFDWFRLARAKGIGTKLLWEVYDLVREESTNLSNFLINKKADIPKISGRLRTTLKSFPDEQDYESIQRAYEQLETNRVKILHPESPDFPSKLKKYGRQYNIPPVLYARGHTPLAKSPSISIVGSRNVGEDALATTSELAKGLARAGFNIVSGYAKGVDSAAHLGALEAEGTTTIVLSLGILNFEAKKEFKPFFTAHNTLVLSQFNPSEKWLARNAMARNKLVCALADAVVVIASGQEIDSKGRMSGTFDAARSAMAMNIPVFVLSPNCLAQPPIGNSDLIQLGCHEISVENGVQQITSVLEKSDSANENKDLSTETVQLSLITSP